MGARLRVDTLPEGVEEAHGWLELLEFVLQVAYYLPMVP